MCEVLQAINVMADEKLRHKPQMQQCSIAKIYIFPALVSKTYLVFIQCGNHCLGNIDTCGRCSRIISRSVRG